MPLDKSHFRVDDAESLLKAMANQARLMILCEVLKGERTVMELHEVLGNSMSPISQHLAVLRYERIVTTRRESQHVYYPLANEAAKTMLGTLQEIYCAPTNSLTRVKPRRRSK